jgi:hypothetical protein
MTANKQQKTTEHHLDIIWTSVRQHNPDIMQTSFGYHADIIQTWSMTSTRHHTGIIIQTASMQLKMM